MSGSSVTHTHTPVSVLLVTGHLKMEIILWKHDMEFSGVLKYDIIQSNTTKCIIIIVVVVVVV